MPDRTTLTLTPIGGPTVLLELAGLRLLTDPTFDPPGGTYPSGAVDLHKTGAPALQPSQLGSLDAVLLSHDQHADNLDTSGRALLAQVPRVFTTADGGLRLGATGLRPWETTELETPEGEPLRITATPARHGPAGIEPIAGEVTGFLLGRGDTDLVYITGDTVYYEGVAEVARRFRPKVILLFGGAAQARGPFNLTMGVNDALDTARAFPDALLVPVHHEGWAHFTQSQETLAQCFEAFGMAERLRLTVPGKPAVFEV